MMLVNGSARAGVSDPMNLAGSETEPRLDKPAVTNEEFAQPRLLTVTLSQLRDMQIAEREMVLSPILQAKGLAMLYAQRGVGKTFVALGISYAVASGTAFLNWQAPRARPILYVDGEMPARAIQDRLRLIEAGAVQPLPTPDHFRILAMDLQAIGTGLNMALPDHQQAVESQLGNAELLVLDNLSTLVEAGRENDAESWTSMQAWLLKLRRMGLAVLMVHHAGRSENARGTSKREDVLDTVIQLRRPDNYLATEGARFEVRLTKARGFLGADAAPFEAKLDVAGGKANWSVQHVIDNNAQQVDAMSQTGMTVRSIAKTIGISKSAASRLQQKLRREGKQST